MKAHKPSTAEQRKIDDKRRAKRAPRRQETGPIGFGQVFSQVKRPTASAAGGAHVDGAARHTAGSMPAGAGGQGAAGQGTSTPGSVPSVVSVAIPNLPATIFVDAEAGVPVPASVSAAGGQAATVQQSFQPQAHVTPAEAMQLVEDAAASMRSESKEIRLSLNPEHLGPLVVQIRVSRGKVRVELYAQNGDAVTLLGHDREKLQARLSKLGYAQAEVVIEQEKESFFTG